MAPQEAKKCFLWKMMEDLNLCTLVKFSQIKLRGSCPLLSKRVYLEPVCVQHCARYFTGQGIFITDMSPDGSKYLPHFTDTEMAPQRDSIITYPLLALP